MGIEDSIPLLRAGNPQEVSEQYAAGNAKDGSKDAI